MKQCWGIEGFGGGTPRESVGAPNNRQQTPQVLVADTLHGNRDGEEKPNSLSRGAEFCHGVDNSVFRLISCHFPTSPPASRLEWHWSRVHWPTSFLRGYSCGDTPAPPDAFPPFGCGWGPPPLEAALRETESSSTKEGRSWELSSPRGSAGAGKEVDGRWVFKSLIEVVNRNKMV